VIAVGVYDDQAASLDRATQGLQQAGYFKATRSFVVQVLVRRLQHDIEGLGPEEILHVFVEKYLRKPLASAPSRGEPQRPQPRRVTDDTRRRSRLSP
jgi:hypothetical protein